jgi:hypothetical protein
MGYRGSMASMAVDVLELDERRRASFGRIGNPEHRRYLVDVEPDGTITLTPAVVVAEHELALLRHPEIVARIEESRTNPSRVVRHPRRKRG